MIEKKILQTCYNQYFLYFFDYFATGKRSICVLTLLLKNGKSPSFLLNESD